MNQLCKVCGEPAAGFHFGAFTCEGCKSFFGRTYNNLGSISECKNNGECVINKKNRTACKACRLRKCLLVGMSKSGSRYGRRSNWFKIHCLLQEQQQQAMHNTGMMAANFLRTHPYLSMFQNPLPNVIDSKNSESDSASSTDLEEEMKFSNSFAGNNSSFSLPESSYRNLNHSTTKISPSSDSECFSNRTIPTTHSSSPASLPSLPSVSPSGIPPGIKLANPLLIPPLQNSPILGSWRNLWLKGPMLLKREPELVISQDQPIDLSVKTNDSSSTRLSTHSDVESEHELNIDVGVEENVKIVPLDLSLETKTMPSLTLSECSV